MSCEKSQLENINLPPQDGEIAQAQKKSPALPPGFSLGRQLIAKGKPTPRSETLKYSMPNYPAGVDRASQEEKEKKAWMEKEGINYDLYLLIKERLAGEFSEIIKEAKIDKNVKGLVIVDKDYINYIDSKIRKGAKGLLSGQTIKENPTLYIPNLRDLIFITNNLKELFVEQILSFEDYPRLGIFLNSFIHAYFNSVPEEKRKDLKINLPNTKGLDFIGSDLSFGELEVDEVRNGFGHNACGSAILKARKAGSGAGKGLHGQARLEAMEADDDFGLFAEEEAVLIGGDVKSFAGSRMKGSARLTVRTATGYFGRNASGSAILKAKEVGNYAGQNMRGKAYMELEEAKKYVGKDLWEKACIKINGGFISIGEDRRESAIIILPDGQTLKSQDDPPPGNRRE